MKIVSWNVNGIRSAYSKGFVDYMKKEQPDILCLQEIKCDEKNFPEELHHLNYSLFLHPAKKPGYSGVAVFTRNKPQKVEKDFGMERFDDEVRILLLTYQEFILIALYIPNGGRDKENMEYKLDVYKKLLAFLEKNKDKKVVVIGDMNIAHEEIDLARPKENKNSTMFTPEEREQLSKLISTSYIDTFRYLHKDEKKYSWWPYFANARTRNLGWRIDYVFISKPLLPHLKGAFIRNEVMGSDHCPIGIELK